MLLRNKRILFFFITAIAAGWLYACSSSPTGTADYTDTPTSGDVNVFIDDAYVNIFKEQIYTFESLYDRAKVHPTYVSEKEAVPALLNDSCKVIVITRDLTPAERKSFEAKNIFPVSTKIAEDAIAIIVNPENTDTALTVADIKQMLSGNDSIWKQVDSKSEIGKINLVFDHQGSANARYMQDTLLGGKEFSKNVFAVKSNSEVIDYVSTHKNAIGFLGMNWISDLDDPKVQAILKKIKVVSVSAGSIDKAVQPCQAFIKTKDYPFTRSVYMINRQTRAGLGMGFVSFVAGEKGQIMILKSGLIPGFPPERTIKVKME